MRDVIYIRDLKVNAILGVLPEERKHPQPVVINIELFTDITTPAQTTHLADTVDYAQVALDVEALTRASQCLLVETLAEKIAELCLQNPRVHQVSLDIAKPQALDQTAAVGVRIERRKPPKP